MYILVLTDSISSQPYCIIIHYVVSNTSPLRISIRLAFSWWPGKGGTSRPICCRRPNRPNSFGQHQVDINGLAQNHLPPAPQIPSAEQHRQNIILVKHKGSLDRTIFQNCPAFSLLACFWQWHPRATADQPRILTLDCRLGLLSH